MKKVLLASVVLTLAGCVSSQQTSVASADPEETDVVCRLIPDYAPGASRIAPDSTPKTGLRETCLPSDEWARIDHMPRERSVHDKLASKVPVQYP